MTPHRHGSTRRYADEVSSKTLAQQRLAAAQLAERAGVKTVAAAQVGLFRLGGARRVPGSFYRHVVLKTVVLYQNADFAAAF